MLSSRLEPSLDLGADLMEPEPLVVLELDVISIDDFEPDQPWTLAPVPPAKVPSPLIHGVVITPLVLNRDKRGSLVVLKNAETEGDEPLVFVYRVTA